MPFIPMYLTVADVKLLNVWLNQQEAVAFLISNGPGKWIAKKEYDILGNIRFPNIKSDLRFPIPVRKEYLLWHVPSGPLPRIDLTQRAKLKFDKEDWDEDKIEDPWIGWEEELPGANRRIPYFGSHPGVIDLTIKLYDEGEIPMSSFGWIGNYYRIIGRGADESTEKFWRKLRRMAKKNGAQIPRGNMPQLRNEVYAFPSAYAEIERGRPCSINP